MNCEKAKAYFPLLNSQSSQDLASKEVAKHVSECGSCALALEKTKKLQSLLALKRHEKPDEFFLRTYVSEFHRRLYSDVAKSQSHSVWTKVREAFSFDLEWSRVAQTMAAVLIVSFIGFEMFPFSMTSRTHHKTASASASSGVVEVESRYNELVASKDSDKAAVYVLDRVSYKPSNNGPVVLQF